MDSEKKAVSVVLTADVFQLFIKYADTAAGTGSLFPIGLFFVPVHLALHCVPYISKFAATELVRPGVHGCEKRERFNTKSTRMQRLDGPRKSTKQTKKAVYARVRTYINILCALTHQQINSIATSGMQP